MCNFSFKFGYGFSGENLATNSLGTEVCFHWLTFSELLAVSNMSLCHNCLQFDKLALLM